MTEPSPPAARLHPAALFSFVLGLASFALCLLGLAGLPALFFGWHGLRAVNSGEGRYTGARLAIAGMALGGLGTVLTAAGIVAILVLNLQQTAAKTTCQDNLRQIGVALNKYADTHGSFPAAVAGPRDLPPDRQLSWMSEVVPLLGEGRPIGQRYQALAKGIDRTKPWDDEANAAVVNTPVRIFLCPASPDFDPNLPPGLTNYVGLAGIGPGAAMLKREDARAGMFGYDRGVKRGEMEGGTSNTIMVLETGRDLGPWLAGGFPTVRELAPDATAYSGRGRPFGGLHDGFMNVLFADSHVETMSDRVSPRVIRQQATLRRPAP
jgi:prepilin-type processing-associated H-X9-DG protein